MIIIKKSAAQDLSHDMDLFTLRSERKQPALLLQTALLKCVVTVEDLQKSLCERSLTSKL